MSSTQDTYPHAGGPPGAASAACVGGGESIAEATPAPAGAHGQQGPTASRPVFRIVQMLRGLAALLVVAHHATIMLSERNHLPMGNWVSGSSGVDIFFVISGFVMTISSAPLLTARHPGRTFLARRLERIVPMYWIVTTAKVTILLLFPLLALNALGSGWHVLCSYLFFPSRTPMGQLEPVVVVGWTLSFEMFFYVLFAAALALRRPPLLLLALPLLCLGIWPLFLRLAGPDWVLFFENSLMLEFLFGMVLGVSLRFLCRLPWELGAVLLPAGLICMLSFRPQTAFLYDFYRGLYWGVPATAVVLGAILLEGRWGRQSPRMALEIGNASYSIYLVHTLVLPGIGLLLAHLQHPVRDEIGISLTLSILLSVAAGELVYRFVERPITRWFKAGRPTAAPTPSGRAAPHRSVRLR